MDAISAQCASGVSVGYEAQTVECEPRLDSGELSGQRGENPRRGSVWVGVASGEL